jgi:beta-N-acetylhexosaminidase
MTRAAELFLVGFSGSSVPAELHTRFWRGDFAGLVFFRRNFASPDVAVSIARDMEGVLKGCATQGLCPILSIDQEGGRVQRLRGDVTVWPPMMSLAEKHPQVCREVGRAMGWELSALGFNVNFAPVLDVHTNPKTPIISDRAFGTRPEDAAERALAFLAGLESEPGVRGCGKHFPGHGDTESDSHLVLPTVKRPFEDLLRTELAPFQRAVDAKIGMLMTAHVVYSDVDARPATLSRVWLHEVLRKQMGFEGVILSDDLDMKAVTAEQLGVSDDSEVVVESLLAGCDAFLFCQDAERLFRAEEALTKAAERNVRVKERMEESAARLARFRTTLKGNGPLYDRVRQFPVQKHLRLKQEIEAHTP